MWGAPRSTGEGFSPLSIGAGRLDARRRSSDHPPAGGSPGPVKGRRRKKPPLLPTRIPCAHPPHAHRSKRVSAGALFARGEPRTFQDGRLQGGDRLVALWFGIVAFQGGGCCHSPLPVLGEPGALKGIAAAAPLSTLSIGEGCGSAGAPPTRPSPPQREPGPVPGDG